LGENIGKLRGEGLSAQFLFSRGSVADRCCIFRDYFSLASSQAHIQATPGTGKAQDQMLKRMAKRVNSVWANTAALL
jgi:hypothetical protein